MNIVDNLQKDDKYWLALGKNPKLGPAAFSEILSKNIPMEAVFTAGKAALSDLRLSERVTKAIQECQEKVIPDKVLEDLVKREINFITIQDDKYPILLKELYDPPAILYYKGKIEDDSLKIGIVGSRRATSYGLEATAELAEGLAKSGITIVSGMAIGIDTAAHRAALDANGRTIAVLGCGIDQIYPSRNLNLVKEIIGNGAIVSEFPIGVPPFRRNFAIRNRLISGLSRGVLITEATEKSGSLITAACALEQNREIFAVPGSIYNLNSQGPNNLLKMGAKLVTSSNDILEELGIEAKDNIQEPPKAENDKEEIIITILLEEPKHIDQIIKESGLQQMNISSTLTMMEISGKVKHIGGMVYKLNR
jgi:DNA processing protein